MMLRVITEIKILEPYRLRLTYADGATMVVDFGPVIQQGGVFAALGQSEFFAQVRLGHRGRAIEWPGELDFCADALWLEGQPEKTEPMVLTGIS